MSTKSRMELRLSENIYNYIGEQAKKNQTSRTAMIERIITEHQAQSDDELEKIADKVLDKFDEKYKNFFTRLRLATNYSEKNIQIALEMLNSLTVAQQQDLYFNTKETPAPSFLEATEFVTERIANYKQRKDNE